ncbi:RING-H2 finger protein ATL32 [Acorus gramineus]|uniref:RING-H2 finger protein ATL32 n=1 Tax=Acorus gramineus TaxID=55184 RepID=A0AAV9A6A8_ACOGR|nr:RING-H2 finger protein ATL32 [Acorus gramineus]
MDSNKDETMIIMRAPCEHMFHENCIITWMKKKQTCPMCRFNMKIKFQIKIDEQIWTCEIDFQDLLHVTLDS